MLYANSSLLVQGDMNEISYQNGLTLPSLFSSASFIASHSSDSSHSWFLSHRHRSKTVTTKNDVMLISLRLGAFA